MRLTPLALLALAIAPQLAAAQQGSTSTGAATSSNPTPVLSLDEAITLARRNNPALQQTLNDRGVAAAQRRTAYGSFVPRVDAGLGASYREGGQQFFAGNAVGASGDIISSSYDLTARLDVSPSTFTGPKLARANVRAAEADIANATENLRAVVVQQYVTVLQRQAQAALQDSLLLNVRAQLELAKARAAVGAGTSLDVKRAEVAVGQQEVASIRAHNDAEVELLRLFQRMGVPQPEGVQLTTRFEVTAPGFTRDQVLQMARQQNPTLRATRARETSAAVGYRNAQGQYLPTLTLYSQWGGFTNQYTDDQYLAGQVLGGRQGNCRSVEEIVALAQNRAPDYTACNSLSLSSGELSSLRSANRAFPFDFTRQPWSVSASLSIPIFNGFQREQRLQEAAAQRADARWTVRAQELALEADVNAAFLSLQTAQRAAEIQTTNAATAREALRLAEERYRVGANTFVDVTQARAEYERAENDRISAIYDYHRAYAALESAVGRPLR